MTIYKISDWNHVVKMKVSIDWNHPEAEKWIKEMSMFWSVQRQTQLRHLRPRLAQRQSRILAECHIAPLARHLIAENP